MNNLEEQGRCAWCGKWRWLRRYFFVWLCDECYPKEN